jgi:Peptidase A4 family
MSRRLFPFMTLAMVVVLSVGAIALSIDTDGTTLSLTIHLNHRGNPYGAASYGFGGYTLEQPATEIGAEWRVPIIGPHSIGGDASTWIAVQNDERQFIQFGTTENSYQNATPLYGIFWSDVAVNFHPQQLLYVAPGDLIKFTMVQVARGWRLRFDDLTTGTPETITVPYGQGSTFDSAQWIQEDPTINGLSTHIPYPTISLTTFSHLTLNATTPDLQAFDGQVLSTADGVYIIPTLPRHDQFTFRNATGPARQYLNDIFAYVAALNPFEVDQFYDRPVSALDLRHIRATLTALELKLTTQTWPPKLVNAVKGDAKYVADLENEFDTFPAAPIRISPKQLAGDHATDERDAHFAFTLRHDLGLPPEH